MKKAENVGNLNLDLNNYNTDKIKHNYLKKYDKYFKTYAGMKVNLLELGILKGGSLKLWLDYFPGSKIVGIDLSLPEDIELNENLYMFQGNQADTDFLSDVTNKVAPEGYDIIIDDASHIGELTKKSFWHLFDNHLKPGGLYVIEDWGTGYWDDWPDGKSLDLDSYNTEFKRKTVNDDDYKIPMPCHSYGMVGFIKQLIDEQAANDVTRKSQKGSSSRGSKFNEVVITSSVVFIKKV